MSEVDVKGHDPAPGAARAHAFVVDLDRPELDAADRHHLERVLRLRPGELVSVSDGAGSVLTCRFGPELEPDGPPRREARPSPKVTVAFAPVKGDRPEWAVQKLTEAGADRIIPLVAERSVVRWEPARAGSHVERLRRVAREAAMQARRAWLPEVGDPVPFADLVAGPGVALAQPGGEPPSLDRPTVLVGPEGGWSPAELAAAPALVSLGPHVLRTETAAVAAGLLLSALRTGVVGPGERLR